MDEAAANDSCRRAALEAASFERRVARLAGGFRRAKCPLAIQRKYREVRGLACGKASLEPKDARRSGGEQFHHPHQRKTPGVNQLLERETQRNVELI